MGMAASQARLLSITARLTNNENTGQSVSYSKQRLADQTQQITNEYNEALDATKLTVLIGFNGAEANYEDISYGLMTGKQMAKNTKQYVVTDTKGRILVSNEIADAYKASRGNYNAFLAKLGYSQADIGVNKNSPNEDAKKVTEEQIHQAWDKYFQTIYLEDVGSLNQEEVHDWDMIWVEGYEQDENGNYISKNGGAITLSGNSNNDAQTIKNNGISSIGNGYAAYVGKDENGNTVQKAINYEGTTEESRDLYDYAMALTEAYYRVGSSYQEEYDLDAYNTNASDLKYYENIFNKIQSSGYFTYTNTPAEVDENHLYTSEGTGNKGNVKKNPLEDNYTFEAALRDGSLRLEYFSNTDKAFIATTLSEDTCIQEVADERAIARAESKYNQDMADLENKDKKLDLELKKLDTEHNALQTEYDAVKSVVDKNVESSFKIFS